MIPSFIASFDVALGRKRLRERKGYLKLSNTIAYGDLVLMLWHCIFN
ncbi:hypothetical protein ACXGXL_001764 [Campylobacter coli]